MKKVLYCLIVILLIIIFCLVAKITILNNKCNKLQEINDRQASAIEFLEKEKNNIR